jgi:hypothetical protein
MSRMTTEDYYEELEAENAAFRIVLQQINDWIVRGGHDLGELVEILDSIGGKR